MFNKNKELEKKIAERETNGKKKEFPKRKNGSWNEEYNKVRLNERQKKKRI